MSLIDCFHLIQITDTHIFANPGDRLADTDTRATLVKVLDQICRREEVYDLVVTGDVSMDGSEASYNWISEQFASRDLRYCVLPGNHDNPEKWPQIFSANNIVCPGIQLRKQWKLIYLNTRVEGQEYGQVCPDSLSFLRSQINAEDASFCVIFMHHPPFFVGSKWIDSIGLKKGKEEFLRLISDPKVKMVFAGHVHQESSEQLGSVKLVTTPSTCVQFLPRSDGFALDVSNPGYRVITLRGDGQVETRVLRL